VGHIGKTSGFQWLGES